MAVHRGKGVGVISLASGNRHKITGFVIPFPTGDGLHDLAGDAYISVLQHVFQSQLQGIYPQLLGDPVHLPLVGSGHLRDAKATIGGSQGLIGHVYIGIHLGVRDLVGAVGGKACVVVHPGIGGDIGAGIPLDITVAANSSSRP